MKILKTKLKYGQLDELVKLLSYKSKQSITDLLSGRTKLISEEDITIYSFKVHNTTSNIILEYKFFHDDRDEKNWKSYFMSKINDNTKEEHDFMILCKLCL